MKVSGSRLIQVDQVKKSFKKRNNQELLVLDKVNFSINNGEVIALLGRSGSGKSTLLRIIAGLIAPSAGEVLFHGESISEPVPGLTMVFQNFALLPWLTVLENVELGLEAQGVKRKERRKRALEAIDIVGLDGFESAYPKELSGGMCQRVGLARALVVDPEVLLMDEPFSALDVLTAENLRGDLINLWNTDKTNIKSILIVTHNIEEAAYLADRILIFGNDPGCIRAEIKVDLPHPRNDVSDEFRALVDKVYTLMTSPNPTDVPAVAGKEIDIGYRLPQADISEIMGLVEMLASPEYNKRVDLPEVAEALHLEIDDLFPITEALEILKFANVSKGDIELTEYGTQLASEEVLGQKKIFADHLMMYVPIVKYIKQTLDINSDHKEDAEFFLQALTAHLSEQASQEVLKVVIDWGRYAECFAYDFNSAMFSLEDPE